MNSQQLSVIITQPAFLIVYQFFHLKSVFGALYGLKSIPLYSFVFTTAWTFLPTREGTECKNNGLKTNTLVHDLHIAPLEEQSHNSKNAHFELCPQEVCLRPYLPSVIASHVYFLKRPLEGRIVVVLLMWLHCPSQWFFLSPEKLYFSSCDSVLLGVQYIQFMVTPLVIILLLLW
jgi:hypothetical protein